MAHDVQLTVLANAYARWMDISVSEALKALPTDVSKARKIVREAERIASDRPRAGVEL